MAIEQPQLSLFKKGFSWPWLSLFGDNSQSAIYDRTLLMAIVALMGFGFVMVMSASMPEAQKLTGNPFHFIIRHIGYLIGCCIIAGVVLNIPVAWWEKHSGHMMLGVFILLVAVLLVGTTVNGARRWLTVGPIRIQVAEIAKFVFIVYLSGYLVRRHGEIRERSKGFIKPIVAYGLIAFLILMQPDLGTVVVLFVCTLSLLFLGGARMQDFIALVVLGFSAFVMLIVLEPYRMRRVTSFMDPWEDPFGSGYQLTQSLMAYGRGDWFGQGLGNSLQKLSYLPEAHTDFIFAVIGEELGFVGIVLVLCVVFFVALRAIMIGNSCLKEKRAFDSFIAYGIGIWICFQTVVNVGASIGMLPTKGLTLPFISYGGSSLWVMTAAVMLLIRIDYERRLSNTQAIQGRGV